MHTMSTNGLKDVWYSVRRRGDIRGSFKNGALKSATAPKRFCQTPELSAPKSQRIVAFSDCDAHRGPRTSLAISQARQSNVTLRFKGAMESR